MKILMTGMASSHCSLKGNVSFFSTLHLVLSELSEVTICEPKLSWTRADLQKYDAVIVGLTPPTALTANKIYGALHVLDLMYESPKLRLVVDGPQVWQFKNSIESFKRNPLQIFGPMHMKRKDYKVALDTQVGSIKSVADKMEHLVWPLTYVPLLPWGSEASAAVALGFITEDRLVGLNLDSFLIDRSVATVGRKDRWAVENMKSTWWSKVAATIRFPSNSTAVGRRSDDAYALGIMKDSMAVAIAPQDRKAGTWWSYRYVQALNTGTPVTTKWQDSGKIGTSWSGLAYQIEDLEHYERQYLADLQYKEYAAAMTTKKTIIKTLAEDLLDSTKESENA
tara:strand:- start:524 stop:1537 length:1014 start_codon:yes stop_codon:yes gene_type:complete